MIPSFAVMGMKVPQSESVPSNSTEFPTSRFIAFSRSDPLSLTMMSEVIVSEFIFILRVMVPNVSFTSETSPFQRTLFPSYFFHSVFFLSSVCLLETPYILLISLHVMGASFFASGLSSFCSTCSEFEGSCLALFSFLRAEASFSNFSASIFF